MAQYEYPIVDPDTALNLQQERLSAEQLQKNKEQLISGIASIGYDLSPVVGEIRSLQFAQDEARNLVSNITSPDPDKLKMIAQGAGIGLGILGAIPIVGYGTRLANRGLQKVYEAFGPGAKAIERATAAGTETRATTDVAQSLHEGLLTNYPEFQAFVRGLPEYRRTTYADNIREFENLSQTERQVLIGNNLDNVVSGPLLRTQSAAVEAEKIAQQEKQNIITQFETAKNKPTKGQLITTVNEPRTFGQGSLQNLGEKQKSVREFIGSEAYDVIAASNIAKATPQQWIGYLTNARQKGVRPEELEDAGLLILNAKGEPIGGELHAILKQDPKAVISKEEILASLETNPAFSMKVKDYEHSIKENVLLEKLPNLKVLNTEAQKILNEKIFSITNVAQRQPVNDLITKLQSLSELDSKVARTLYTADPKQYLEAVDKLREIAGTLPQNQAQVIRTLADDYAAFAKMNEDAIKMKKVVQSPRHEGIRPKGGYDYREKIIYYDNPIPGNSDLKRVYSSHFNEANPPVFTRYDTRGVDNYGDTFFVFEMQSDPHQTISKNFGKLAIGERDGKYAVGTADKMVRNNPFGTKIQNEVVKRERQTILDEQKMLTDKAEKTPLTNKEMGRLIELDSNLKMLNMRTMTRPADSRNIYTEKQLQKLVDQHYKRDSFDTTNFVYDYFPMGKESTWVKLGLKSIINSAQREGKRYVALAPADFFQLHNNTKFKIEQFYGLGLEKGALQGKFAPRNPELKLKEQKAFLGGPEGLGKYRKNTRITEGDKKQPDTAWYPGELAGDAVLPKAAKDIVKEMGGKIEAKRVYLTDPAKPYKILKEGKPAYAFKTKNERDIIFEDLKRNESQLNIMDDVDVNDPSNFVWSIVIDTNGMNKTPSKGYRYGGLVQAKREFFAPLI